MPELNSCLKEGPLRFVAIAAQKAGVPVAANANCVVKESVGLHALPAP
jgi:hypothetical protein